MEDGASELMRLTTYIESETVVENRVRQDTMEFKHVCWLYTRHAIVRYLMSNAEGRWSGGEKAERHMELCKFYVAAVRGHDDPDTVRRQFEDDYQSVHRKTQILTDNLDTEIDFPLKGRPNYEKLDRAFFDKFHDLAMSALMPW